MSQVLPDYNKSIEFLQQWNPVGPWVLTAIDPDKKAIDTESFVRDDVNSLRIWLEDHGRRRNIYFTVNPVTRAIRVKPSREHISALAWLHVDLDPRAGEDLEAERRRILGLLQDPSAKGLPKPS